MSGRRLDLESTLGSQDEQVTEREMHRRLVEVFRATPTPALSPYFLRRLEHRLRTQTEQPHFGDDARRGPSVPRPVVAYWLLLGPLAVALVVRLTGRGVPNLPDHGLGWALMLIAIPLSLLLALDPGAWFRRLRAVARLLLA